MISDTKLREVALRLRGAKYGWRSWERALYDALGVDTETAGLDMLDSLADLIEPSYKPNAEYEAWYDGLSHFGDERGGPSTIPQLIEEIVWTALTVDLGPNGNTDSTGVDEGRVYTNQLFAEWEREALRLSGGCDRDALLALADEIDQTLTRPIAHRIREALGGGGQMNVTFVNDLDLCPFADIETMHQQFLSLEKGVMNVTVILACEHAEICKYRQSSDGKDHVS